MPKIGTIYRLNSRKVFMPCVTSATLYGIGAVNCGDFQIYGQPYGPHDGI